MVVRTEGAVPTAWVYVDVVGRDIGSYVADARQMVDRMVTLPPGYSIAWSGQFEYLERAVKRVPGEAGALDPRRELVHSGKHRQFADVVRASSRRDCPEGTLASARAQPEPRT